MTSKYGLMSLSKKELWKAAGSRLDAAIEKLRRRPFTELMALVGQDEGGPIEIDGVKMFVSCWAKKEEDGSVGVIVEARRMRFFGWSQVRVRGFFAFPDGGTKDMQEKDLWAHGY